MNIEAHATVMNLSIDQALKNAKSHISKGEISEAHDVLNSVLNQYADGVKSLNHQLFQNSPEQGGALELPSENIVENLKMMHNSGQLMEVIDEAILLSQQYPTSVDIWNILGVAAAQLKRMPIAIGAFRSVTKLEPSSPDSHNNLGNALIESGEPEQGIEALKIALSIKPEFPEAHYNMGNAFLDLGLIEKAIDAYTKALEHKLDYAEAFNNKGNALKQMGMDSEALECYKNALKFNPNYTVAERNFNNLAEQIGQQMK